MDALAEENPIKRDAMKLYITLKNVASTADMLHRTVGAINIEPFLIENL